MVRKPPTCGSCQCVNDLKFLNLGASNHQKMQQTEDNESKRQPHGQDRQDRHHGEHRHRRADGRAVDLADGAVQGRQAGGAEARRGAQGPAQGMAPKRAVIAQASTRPTNSSQYAGPGAPPTPACFFLRHCSFFISDMYTPEIVQICSDLAGHEVRCQFTPHLIPMVRGILSTVYATLRDPNLVRDDLITIYNAFYRTSPFVKILPGGVYPQTKWACGTNLCYLGIEVDPRTDRVIVMSAIDNLVKGQSGQAVQCLNLMMGWEESLALPQMCFYP